MLFLNHIRPILIASLLIPSCANPHFFPRTRPLFVGFDDSQIPASKRESLDQAKVDFMLARRGESPRFATYVRKEPYSLTKVYQGNGYELTRVDSSSFSGHEVGPKIVIDSKITGDEPFVYDEVDLITY